MMPFNLCIADVCAQLSTPDSSATLRERFVNKTASESHCKDTLNWLYYQVFLKHKIRFRSILFDCALKKSPVVSVFHTYTLNIEFLW